MKHWWLHPLRQSVPSKENGWHRPWEMCPRQCGKPSARALCLFHLRHPVPRGRAATTAANMWMTYTYHHCHPSRLQIKLLHQNGTLPKKAALLNPQPHPLTSNSSVSVLLFFYYSRQNNLLLHSAHALPNEVAADLKTSIFGAEF